MPHGNCVSGQQKIFQDKKEREREREKGGEKEQLVWILGEG